MKLDRREDLGSFLAKLERRAPLSAATREAFLALPATVVNVPANRDIAREGGAPGPAFFIKSGVVSRYKTLRNGSRQTLSFNISGDLTGLHHALVAMVDNGIRTHVDSEIITVDTADMLKLAATHFELARAFWLDALAEAARVREWVVNIGRRDARSRTAHLLLELATLHDSAGLADNMRFHFPVTQNDLADALGLTSVHLNRVLQWLRRAGLIRTQERLIIIEDRKALTTLSGFDDGYLHLKAIPDITKFGIPDTST